MISSDLWSIPGGVIRSGESENEDGEVRIKPSCFIRIMCEKLLDEKSGKLTDEYQHMEQELTNLFNYRQEDIIFRGVVDDRQSFKLVTLVQWSLQIRGYFFPKQSNKGIFIRFGSNNKNLS